MANWKFSKYKKFAVNFKGRAARCKRILIPQAQKALQHAYRNRHVKRRLHKARWLAKVDNASREHGLDYSKFKMGLTRSNMDVNRKMLADLAENEPYSFKALFDEICV